MPVYRDHIVISRYHYCRPIRLIPTACICSRLILHWLAKFCPDKAVHPVKNWWVAIPHTLIAKELIFLFHPHVQVNAFVCTARS